MTLSTVRRYQSGRVQQVGEHATVIGGSLAGLCAARVLADGYETVTIIEKDSLPDDSNFRRGVPQGPQIHALQEAGRATLEDLFPGFGEDIISAGGLLIDGASDFKFYDEGGFLADGTKRFPMYFATRPLFENVIRRRVASLGNVKLKTGCQFTDCLFDSETMTIEGIAVREGSDQKRIAADLVVDATGRTSRTPTWLDSHGFDAPEIDEVQIDLGYCTTAIRRPPDNRRTIFAAASPPRTRGGAVFPVEDNCWLVNLHGMNGDHPPTDPEGFADFAASLPIPQIHRFVETHPQVWQDIEYYPFPSNRRVHYENLDRFPDGLIVLGDAIASFNPIYGQGMSVAALEALMLHHVLASVRGPNFALAFFDRVQTIIDTAWTMAIGADVQFPETTGPTPPGTGMFAWYLSRLTRKAHSDGELRDALARVASMEHPPTRLLRPGVAWRVLKPEILRGEHTSHVSSKAESRRTS